MKTWNTPDHTIADTEHGTLTFTGGTQLVIADWQVTEEAPDRDGRVYATIRGWLANESGAGTLKDPHTQPIEAGRAHLIHAELRGRKPVSDRDVHVDYESVGRPYPNTWDHPGSLVTVTWMDRRIDADGHPVPEDEIGRTEWTHPETGQVFDLTERYLPAGKYHHDDPQHPGFTWQHFDRWSADVPVLHAFYGDHKSPAGDTKLLTDGEWVRAADAPKFSQITSPANS